ncbi:MAG: exodeoxyribonuclease VII large subunit [Campylobacterales bacterium]|nr:exodeoxyribonuclease VII large subunit [Campylobacterales bacterium]
MMSVTSLNTKIKSLLEATFMHILVEGEVASVTYHTSGHVYFSIKDDQSSIKCVMFKSNAAKLKFRLEEGLHIVVEGSVGVYTPRGEYQFYAVHIEPYGQGALALAYEQLKEKLKEKGYFDPLHKKAIPSHIQRIALVTAKESAALYDMLKIIEKRWPLVDVFIVDTLVQGEQAPFQIQRSLRYADSLGVDVVVVGRGGGSTEDLWCFNDEKVADAIFEMKTPVVSAVGHEVDVMISDFVADLRAPTPSAAMEMILPDRQEILFMLDDYAQRYKEVLARQLEQKSRTLKHIEEIFVRSSPLKYLNESQENFKRLGNEFQRAITYRIERFGMQLPDIQKHFLQTMRFNFKQFEQECFNIQKQFELKNPALSYKKGWVQLSSHGQIMELSELHIDQKFNLEDTEWKIEAVCLDRKKFFSE